MVIEQRDEHSSEDGADLGLWPSSVKILKELGILPKFWTDCSYPVHKVYMEKMEQGKPREVLKVIDMDKVTAGTGEYFRLIGRRELMDAMKSLVKPEVCCKNPCTNFPSECSVFLPNCKYQRTC